MILRFNRLLLLFSLLALAGRSPLAAQPIPEFEVKAAFLYNFIRFTDWPEEAFAGPQEPFIIGVLGRENPFGNKLEAAVRGKTIDDRPLQVRFAQRLREFGQVHILYISSSAPESQEDLLQALSGRPVVTVGETADFTAEGGVIRFFVRDRKIAFEINPTAAKRGELRLSSRLLSLARIYREPAEVSP